jgi:hypothetical protein
LGGRFGMWVITWEIVSDSHADSKKCSAEQSGEV